MSWREDLKWEALTEFINMHEKIKLGGRGQVMEYSETALPTCYRIFYNYGDFSVAPSFA